MEIKKVIERIGRIIIASGAAVFCACVIFLAGVSIVIAAAALVNHALHAYIEYTFGALVESVIYIVLCMVVIAAFAVVILFAAGGIYMCWLCATEKE